jgi:hypothetical protein
MLSPERPAPLCVERVVVQRLNLAFDTSKPAQKESASRGQKVFSYHSGLGLVVLDEQNGALLDVKRNLALRSLWRGQTCRSNYDHFYATPKTLDAGKRSQHRQTNDND